jgi:adenylate kinase family enzyme
MRRGRVHVLGASGSGTTTLARALADHWSVPHADADDYFWMPSKPPFLEKRPEADRVALMREVFVAREAWVLSGSMMEWGDEVTAECDAVVFITLDLAERLRRLEAREIRRRAGDEYDEAAWLVFRDWAVGYDDPDFDGRSRANHEAWLAEIHKPVLRLDSRATVPALLETILTWEPLRR